MILNFLSIVPQISVAFDDEEIQIRNLYIIIDNKV